MIATPYSIAERYVGVVREVPGDLDHPFIQWCLSLCFDGKLDLPDKTPWCSAYMQHPFWELRLPRSKSARARSWIRVGSPVRLDQAQQGDVVVLNRAGGPADPDIIEAPGHVGCFSGTETRSGTLYVSLLGGNQGDAVSIQSFRVQAPDGTSNILAVRRVA